MANLTITVDEEDLKRARIRAIESGTSVNALLADALSRYARAGSAQDDGIAALLELAARRSEDDLANAQARGGRGWKREDLYDR